MSSRLSELNSALSPAIGQQCAAAQSCGPRERDERATDLQCLNLDSVLRWEPLKPAVDDPVQGTLAPCLLFGHLSADELNLNCVLQVARRKLICVAPRSKAAACERQFENSAGKQLGSI